MPDTEYKENSQAVQAHLTLVQSVIQRMATNSSSCKAWCITLVSAILVIVADKGKPQYAWIAVIPSVLFLFLDMYYLAYEREFRRSYNDFIKKLHYGKVTAEDLYVIAPTGNLFIEFLATIKSFSIWSFYITLLVMVYIAYRVVI